MMRSVSVMRGTAVPHAAMPGAVVPGVVVRYAVVVALVMAWSGSGWTQIMLPGATNGVASEQSARTAGGDAPKAPAKPIQVKPPADETVLGQRLSFDGAKGAMRFDRAGGDVTLTKLTLPGVRLSDPGKACDVDIVAEHPIVAATVGRPAGAIRWSLAVEACPFTVDVLDGAALVSSAQPSCDFVAADCRVSPVGLWGPPASAIPPQRVKDLERDRVRTETVMRTNFRVLLHRAGKDRAAVKAIAGEQAAFSSEREMTCRDYAGETVHGFCSTQITEARSLAILAKLTEDDAAPDPAGKPAAKRPSAVKKPPPQAKAAVGAATPARSQESQALHAR